MTARPDRPVSPRSGFLSLCFLLVTLSGCSRSEGPDKILLQFTIASKESLTTPEMKRAGGKLTPLAMGPDGVSCQGGGGFSSFTPNSRVEAHDEHGKTLGVSSLGEGTLQGAGTDIEGQPVFNKCHFRSIIPLNDQARIYVLRIGGEGLVKRFHVTQLQKLNGNIALKVD